MLCLLDTIPFEIQGEQLYSFLKIKPGSKFAHKFDKLVKEAVDIARPKAIYKLSSVEKSEGNSVLIDDIKIESRVVRVNLDNCGRVFPFIATCGIEIEEWANGFDNQTHRFWADAIQIFLLGYAIDALKKDIQNKFETDSTSTMNPGSLQDWPISGQQTIFSLIGEAYKQTGVQLTDNFMIRPLKSASGLEFASNEKFYNCQLCPKDNCSMRRAPYDEHLYSSKYQEEIK
jgi:hypothetical protein